MKSRRVPIVSLLAHLPSDPSAVSDTKYFLAHPHVEQFERPYISGETIEPMPLGTRVVVKRIGKDRRARAFLTPNQELN